MPPNVLLLVIDALRADRVGALGGRELTPNIDNLAADSAVFSNAYSVTNTTDPAVTSIQTGRYPLSHGILNHGRQVTDEEKQAVEAVPQLPEILSEAGYHTAKIGRPLGRWHRKGFDVYPSKMETRVAFDADTSAAEKTRQNIGDALSTVHPAVRDVASQAYQLGVRSVEKAVSTAEESQDEDEDSTDEVVRRFEKVLSESNPFYAFVHLMDTHKPYTVSPSLVRSYLERFDYDVDIGDTGEEKISHSTTIIPDDFYEEFTGSPYHELIEKYYYTNDQPSTAVIDAHYDAAVTEADQRIGHILDVLEKQGLLDETLVVLCADHGESLTDHGIYYGHHGLYDATTHVPLIVRPPGGVSQTIEELVQITDITPTITSYLEIDGLEPDGQSLQPIIEEKEPIDRTFVMAEESHTQRRRMVRTDTGKLIYLIEGDTICRNCGIQHAPEVEFYNLGSDPNELQNVSEEQIDSVDRFRDWGNERATELIEKQRGSDEESLITYEDEEKMYERLDALGYR